MTYLSFISVTSEAQSLIHTIGRWGKCTQEFSGNLKTVQTSAVITTILFAASSLGRVSSLSPFVLKETWPLVEIPKVLTSTKGDPACTEQTVKLMQMTISSARSLEGSGQDLLTPQKDGCFSAPCKGLHSAAGNRSPQIAKVASSKA